MRQRASGSSNRGVVEAVVSRIWREEARDSRGLELPVGFEVASIVVRCYVECA